MGLPQFQLLPLLSLLQASSMLRMSLDSSALDTRTSTLPRLKLRMLLERPEEVTSMLMPMEFSRLSTTLLMTSMDSELLEPTSQLPLRLLLLLDQLLLLQLLWLHQWPLRRHLRWLLLELNILLQLRKPRLMLLLLMNKLYRRKPNTCCLCTVWQNPQRMCFTYCWWTFVILADWLCLVDRCVTSPS